MVKQYRTGFISNIYFNFICWHYVTHHNILEATVASSSLYLPEEGNGCFPNVACYIVTMESVKMNISDKTRVKSLPRMYMIQSLKFQSSLSLLMSVATPSDTVALPGKLESSTSAAHDVPAHLLMWRNILCTHHFLTETLNTWHTILWLMYVVCAAMRT